MELVLVRLEVSELGKLLAAIVELAGKGFDLLVDNLVGAHISALSECLPADVAAVRSLSSVASFMSLQIAKLGESLAARRLLAHEGFDTSMGACVDF